MEGRALRLWALAFDRTDPAGDASGYVRPGRPDEHQPGRVPRLAARNDMSIDKSGLL